MAIPKIKQRIRFFIAVEGEGEQAFIKWLQTLCDSAGLHVHLDCVLLGGGGYEIMLNQAIFHQKHKERHKVKASILLIDADRAANNDDNWTIETLKEQALFHKITVCAQIPNQEGLFLRMFPGCERLSPDASNVKKKLLKKWPEYKKPVDAYALKDRFTQDALLRVAKFDEEIKNLLTTIGLMR